MAKGFAFDVMEYMASGFAFDVMEYMAKGFAFDVDISSLTCIFSEPHLLEVTMPRLRSENLRIYTSERRSLHRISKRVKSRMFFGNQSPFLSYFNPDG